MPQIETPPSVDQATRFKELAIKTADTVVDQLKYIESLEKTLASFMAHAVSAGGPRDPDQIAWIQMKLQGEHRSGGEIFQTEILYHGQQQQ